MPWHGGWLRLNCEVYSQMASWKLNFMCIFSHNFGGDAFFLDNDDTRGKWIEKDLVRIPINVKKYCLLGDYY